jgi:hypothetical protein
MDAPEVEKPLKPSDHLWRYMSFAKLVSLLSTATLYLPRSDQFDDPFEGALCRGDQTHELLECYSHVASIRAQAARCAAQNPDRPLFYKLYDDSGKEVHSGEWNAIEKSTLLRLISEYPDPDELEKVVFQTEFEREKQRFLKLMEKQYFNTYIYCWHRFEKESEAMWKLYSTNIQECVAIQTTAGQVMSVIPGNPHCLIRPVRYEHNIICGDDPVDRFFSKRTAFDYENEVRIVHQAFDDNTNSHKSISLAVDVSKIINKIAVSPFAKTWLVDVVKDACMKYGMNVPVEHSILFSNPFKY